MKIDYIAALVQLLGHELHDLSNRNVNKPLVTETRKTRVLKNYEPDGDMAMLSSKKRNIYIQPVGLNREFLPRPENRGSKYSRKPWLEKRTRMKEWRTTCSPFPLCLFLARDTKLVTCTSAGKNVPCYSLTISFNFSKFFHEKEKKRNENGIREKSLQSVVVVVYCCQ